MTDSHRRISRSRFDQFFSDDLLKTLGCEPIAWSYTSDAFLCNSVTSVQALDKIKRASKLRILLFTALATVIDLSQRFPHCCHAAAKIGQFGGLKRKTIVRPPAATVQGEMLFDDRRPQSDTGDGRIVVKRVVRQSGNSSKALDHVRDGAQVVVLRRGGVAAHAVENGKFLAAAGVSSVDGLLNLLGVSHPGGDDHRLAGAGDVLNQEQVDGLEGGDLIGWGVEVLEQVDGGVIEGGTEDGDVVLARVFEQRLVPLPWHVRFLVKLIERLAIPQAAVDLEFFGVAVQGDGVGGVGLQLDSIGAGLLRLLDDLHRGVELAVVVSGELGDDVGRGVGSNPTTGDKNVWNVRHWLLS